MMKQSNRTQHPWDRILDLNVQDVLEMSPDEIKDARRSEGLDPDAVVQEGRRILQQELHRHGDQLRRQARKEYRKAVSTLNDQKGPCGGTYKDKLAVLKSCLDHNQYLLPVVTSQHRQFDKLTQRDLDSLLHQLIQLGLIERVER